MANQPIIEDENYKSILAYENRTARIITAKILEKPELSAWMILIPIVFLPFMQRYHKYKESSKAFSAGYLYTKKIALETAYRIFKNSISSEEALAQVTKTIQTNPSAGQLVLNIYNLQIEEIKLLCEHYLGLLASKEDNYEHMIVSHYQTQENYIAFLKQLAASEKEVTRASAATFKEDAVEVPEIMEKMENYLKQLRHEEAKQFFQK